MALIPAVFSVKGYASLTFRESKPHMDAPLIWNTITKIYKYYPEKIKLYFSSQRGSSEQDENTDSNTVSVIMDMAKGCIRTCSIKESTSLSMSLLLGSCYEYKIPFGIESDDVGHRSIILTLPFPMSGCYSLTGRFSGAVKKGEGAKEHYMLDMNLDIYIGELSDKVYQQAIGSGTKIYPFKLNHPQYFPRADSSESEPTTDNSEADEPPSPRSQKALHRKGKSSFKRASGILRKSRVSSAVNRNLLEALNQVKEITANSSISKAPNRHETALADPADNQTTDVSQ